MALLALFIWTQARSSHPTIDVSLFKNRQFSAGAAAIAAAFFALQGSTFYLAYYLQAATWSARWVLRWSWGTSWMEWV